MQIARPVFAVLLVWAGVSVLAAPVSEPDSQPLSANSVPAAGDAAGTTAEAPATEAANAPPAAGEEAASAGTVTAAAAQAGGGDTRADAGPEVTKEASEEAALPSISPELLALRDRVRATLMSHFRRPMNLRESSAGDVIQLALAFGCDATVESGNTAVNAMGALCWNYPCAGYQLLIADKDALAARIGYGMQEKQGQLLAVLAQGAVPADYEVRVGSIRRTVADLVQAEKLACQDGVDLSQSLIGLAFYGEPGASWQNRGGQEWSLGKMVAAEVRREVSPGDAAVTDRLMGLSFALAETVRRKQSLEGEMARADRFLADYVDYVVRLQNADGTWHPTFFAYQGTSSDAVGTLNSTGRVLEWLAFSLPPDRLLEPPVTRAAAAVNQLLGSAQLLQSPASATSRGIAARMHALRALGLYNKRAFPEVPGAEPPAAKEAG